MPHVCTNRHRLHRRLQRTHRPQHNSVRCRRAIQTNIRCISDCGTRCLAACYQAVQTDIVCIGDQGVCCKTQSTTCFKPCKTKFPGGSGRVHASVRDSCDVHACAHHLTPSCLP